ncbi:hypothetical protein E2320_014360, partial [Naja naja]
MRRVGSVLLKARTLEPISESTREERDLRIPGGTVEDFLRDGIFLGPNSPTEEKSCKCEQCGLCFPQTSQLLKHQIHTREIFPYKQCLENMRKFTKSPYKSFKNIFANIKHTQRRKANVQNVEKNHCQAHMGEKHHKCSVCEKSFTWKASLVMHQRTHLEKQYKCPEYTLLKHQRTHLEKQYKCPECEQTFTQKGSLLKHQRTHLEEQYKCPEYLQVRMNNPHRRKTLQLYNGVEDFGQRSLQRNQGRLSKCSQCGKSFAHRSLLLIHRKLHTGSGSHLCFLCGNSFPGIWSFAKHLRSHPGVKPYKCGQCGERFAKGSDLGAHQRIHQGRKRSQESWKRWGRFPERR